MTLLTHTRGELYRPSLAHDADILRRNDALYVRPGKFGLGLFAARPISRGQDILQFSGSVINFEQAVKKGEDESYPLQVGTDKYLDLDNIGKYCNHSCEPNAGIRNDVILMAIADIDADGEVFYDYSTSMDEDWWTMSCKCEAATCRSLVRDFKYLPASVRERYLALGIVQGFIVTNEAQRTRGNAGAGRSAINLDSGKIPRMY
jgi:hypothetical protein